MNLRIIVHLENNSEFLYLDMLSAYELHMLSEYIFNVSYILYKLCFRNVILIAFDLSHSVAKILHNALWQMHVENNNNMKLRHVFLIA